MSHIPVHSVRPELVEGSFFLFVEPALSQKQGRSFDKLEPV
jgi:hypothetical protein